MGFLIDTNVASELRKRQCDPSVRRWFEGVPEHELFVSVLVLGEIRRGVERLRANDPAQAAALESWLHELRGHFADRVLPVTLDVADLWGRLGSARPVAAVDGLLAATAIVHGLTLVTRNTRDVADTGVSLLNPFARAASP